MNPARLLVLGVVMCVTPISVLAEDLHPKNLIRMDLYQEGNRADQASDYVTALKNLSAFKKVNNARLAGATTSGEVAFRDALEVKLKQLTRKIEQNTVATNIRQSTGADKSIQLSGTQTASNTQKKGGTGTQLYKYNNKTDNPSKKRSNQSTRSVNH